MAARPISIVSEPLKLNLGCSDAHITGAMKSPLVKEKVKEIQEKIWGRDPKKWIESILPDAIKTAMEIMQDENQKGSVRLQAAETFMDRAMGKATQKLEVNDSTMRKVIEKLDNLESLKKQGLIDEKDIIEAEIVETKDAPSDEVDKWVRENYPK